MPSIAPKNHLDLGWPWTAILHATAQMMHLSELTVEIWEMIDPYYQWQKCSLRVTWSV